MEVGPGRVAGSRWLFFLRQSLTRLPRPRRKCPERRRRRPIGAGLGDASGRAGRARGRKGRAGPAPPSWGRHLSRPDRGPVVGDAGPGGRTDPSPRHTRVCKVNFSWSRSGRGEPPSPPPQVAGAGVEMVPGPLRKGALPPGLHPAPTAGERVGNWVSGPVGSLGPASPPTHSQLCPFTTQQHPQSLPWVGRPERPDGQRSWPQVMRCTRPGPPVRESAEGGWGYSLPSAPHCTPSSGGEEPKAWVPGRAIATSEDKAPTRFHRWRTDCSGEMALAFVCLWDATSPPQPVSPSADYLTSEGLCGD